MIAFIASFLLACTARQAAECSEEVPCPFGSMCVEGVCESRGCATSEQCGIEQYCADGTCVDGCAEDADCMFGDVCNADAKTCEAGECADTRTDCGFGEFCSPAGECYDAGGYYCRPCQDDGDCGGLDAGNYCISGYCGVECQTSGDCPAGYDCLPFQDGNGNIITHQCWTYCWLYEESE